MKGLNCPNCGAPITGDKCEYCGTVFEQPEEAREILYADGKPVVTILPDTVEYDSVRNIYKLKKIMTPNEMRKAAGFLPRGLQKEKR